MNLSKDTLEKTLDIEEHEKDVSSFMANIE